MLNSIMKKLHFKGDGEHVTLELNKIDEFFYVVEVDETAIRVYEKPLEYQIVTGRTRYRIDLDNFDNEDIINLNMMLTDALGGKFNTEERYLRKTNKPDWVKQMNQREFIQLDTVETDIE